MNPSRFRDSFSSRNMLKIRRLSTFSKMRLDTFKSLEGGRDHWSNESLKAHGGEPILSSTLWHSSAHLLGAAMEVKYGDDCFLTDGPATIDGFFYDAFLLSRGEDWIKSRALESHAQLTDPKQIQADIKSILSGSHGLPYFPSISDLKELTKSMLKIARKDDPFEYITVTRDEAQSVFISSPFKLAILSRIPPDQAITIFKCGDFIDLCRGPHIHSAGLVKAVILNKTSAAQWSPSAPQNLSRVYGISFESHTKMTEYKTLLIEAERRNHRKIGKAQGLFTFHHHSPGSPFFLPHGTRIIQRLKEFLRKEYVRYGFQEVVTPLIFNKQLWKTSGHWENYKDDMFVIGSDKQEEGHEHEQHGIKPMNCPGHCLLFTDTGKSYRDLPLRYAEFSPLHRNEASGALTGLTRVRKFHQDDGHIFCTREQIKQEIDNCLEFVDRVYTILGFPNFKLALSTRPEKKYIGTIEEWDHAEESLKLALEGSGKVWEINREDGAFYGPKIDIMIQDALGRSHQTATIQLDFQLGKRFKLSFMDPSGSASTPVIIHRAVLGSLERMLGILIENYAGKWPFWLSPRQAIIITTRKELQQSAAILQKELLIDKDFYIDLDTSDNTLAKQVRDAQSLAYNFILVFGDREFERGTLSVRTRDGKELGEFKVDQLRAHFDSLTKLKN